MRVFKHSIPLLLLCMMLFGTTIFCTDLDSIQQGQNQTTQGETVNGQTGTGDEAFDSISDYMKGYNAVTKEDMAKADSMVSPIASLIGTAIGVINLLTVALMFLTTSLDLLYIAVPFTRNILCPGGGMQQAGGYGGMGMRGGMGMGMAGGQQGGTGHKWVSDEAVNALAMAQPQGGGMAGGMGMGMAGGMGMQGNQQAGGKSAILTYLKKRTVFLIVFAIATTILMSSLLLDCGINLAQLLYKIGEMLNSGISGVQIG